MFTSLYLLKVQHNSYKNKSYQHNPFFGLHFKWANIYYNMKTKQTDQKETILKPLLLLCCLCCNMKEATWQSV